MSKSLHGGQKRVLRRDLTQKETSFTRDLRLQSFWLTEPSSGSGNISLLLVSNSRGELKANVALPFILSHRDPRVKSHILSGKQNDFLFPSPNEKLNDANG